MNEDDPLAELARIVGFDPVPEIKPHAIVQRREPEFDLEDELLKEFEQYEAPEPVAVHAPVEEPVFAAAPSAEPMFVAPPAAEPEFEPEPEVDYLPDVEADVVPDLAPFVLHEVEKPTEFAVDQEAVRPESHPVFDLEDEILREFAAFDARHVSTAEPSVAPVTAEVIRQEPSFEEPAVVELEPVAAAADPFLLYQVPELAIEPSHDDRDVQNEQAYAAAPEQAEDFEAQNAVEGETPAVSYVAAPEVVEPEDEAFAPVYEEPEVQADFTVDDASYWADVEQESSARHEAVTADIVLDSDDMSDAASGQHFSDTEFDAAPVQQSAEIEDIAPSPFHGGYDDDAPQVSAVEPAVEHSAPPVADESQTYRSPVASQSMGHDYGLDALLAEVERYPVGDTTGRWGVQAKAATPDDLIQPPVSDVENVLDGLSSADEPKFDVVEQAPLAYAPHQAAPEETAAEEIAFDENSFELDFGDIELDLAELHDDVTASPEALSEVADADVDAPEIASADMGRAQAYAMRVSEPAPQEDYSSLPFDPSQIVLEEDAVEALAEMDVPEIPVVHDEEKPAQHAEYDLDIDADMANLFGAAASQTPNQPVRQASQGDTQFASAQAPAAQTSAMELDEFERALEEDFRRSFTENRNVGTPDRVALTPTYRRRTKAVRGRRTWALLAGSAIAIVLFGGAGVWAFMSGETKMLTSSEPKIILADKDPVKVVPDDKGGRQVPNQNKAVYDRVSGETTEVAKQESLLSSTEEPVDVVQRTLMPENLPMDDDAMAAVTATDDTIDPRLLPEEERERVTTTSRVTSGVSPRKVKTMVVKSDGSLMAREETAEDIQQQVTNDAELMKIAKKAAQDAATPVDTSGDDIAKAIENVPERLAPADENAAVAELPVKAVETTKVAPVQEDVAKSITPPVVAETEVVKADTIDPAKVEKQPLADANSAEVPVVAEEKPADTSEVKTPVERSIPATDTQTTDAKPVDSQAADDSAVTAAANAEVADAPVRKVKTSKIMPVPEVRPVDQPVTVVGTVTDQGNVQDKAAKQQEVASIDPVEKPAETAALPAGSYVIQIASLPSEADAQNSYSKLSAKFANVIGGRGVDIKRAEIKNKGTYYRVRIPAGSKQEAQQLCSQYKQAGGSCLVSK
ncbi:SPOR domain-containing protein [Rhizobium sp. TH2]|uniref:SPOR domain-containing protein n=1 Tax=Rhizobium sp. TH2 TaxID=2775403 RepID=UPI0021578C4F|nr:SPOR domain-containing protein [Rhizobium sp. TH2]UVC10844.1 SPOR domain-containing protein [Rhizobium sp. TH2]